MKAITSTLAVLGLMAVASIGFGNNQAASMTTASAPGYESKTALHAPPAINTIALQFKDTAGNLAIVPTASDPAFTSASWNYGSQIEGLGIVENNTGNTVAHYTAAPPTNIAVLKTPANLATNGATPVMVNTHAPNAGLYGMAFAGAVLGLDTSPAGFIPLG